MRNIIENFLSKFIPEYKQKHLAKTRKHLSKDEFIRMIVETGGDSLAAASIWGRLLNWGLVPQFTPYPDDNFLKIYGLAEEDLDEDLILEVLKEQNIPVPNSKTVNDYGEIDTPRRLAQFVMTIKRQL